MYLGVDYYPEQWPFNIMDEDLDRMVELGVNIVRIGEFAWHIFEKEEGKIDFSYFDMVIDKLKRKGIKVIIGTPTATPPAWLIKKHEDILSVDEDGMKRSFGGRREYCYNSYIYRQYSEKIVREMVKHYSSFENVICYQVDNELGHEGSDMCYCDNCHEGFHKFLKDKYKNIDELNKAYGTVFWSQTYNDFTEIPLPLKTITNHNPALMLDFMRFKSVSLNDYAKFQVEIIKKFKGKHQSVTTNIAGGFFDKYFDHEETVSSMDFASYDNYPVWGGLKEPVEPCETALAQDFIRGLKNKNFWIVEELMGAQGHTIIGYLPRPNQAKMWAYQAFAHGCSDMLFFRYRGATFGTEEFCYGIIDQDNRNGRKFKEVKELFADIKNYEEVINTKIESKIAIVYDYENIWSFKIQPQSDAFSYLEEFKRFYRPFYKLNAHVDVISTKKDFSGYKVLILPVMMVFDEDLKTKVEEFVKNGGTLVISYRAGIKDRNNNLVFSQISPGIYKELAGVTVEEIESLGIGQEVKLIGKLNYEGHCGRGYVFRDLLKLEGAKALYEYDDPFFKNMAAITLNEFSKGKVYYIGTGASEEIMDNIAKEVTSDSNIDTINTPKGLEAYIRGCENNRYMFLMNHSSKEIKYMEHNFAPYESLILKLN